MAGGSNELGQPQPSARQISPVLPPRLALAEMAVLLALVLAEYFWDGFPSLTRINPHPYWIAILLLSLQYGTVSGLVAASISILGTVLIGMPEPEIEERYFNYLVRVWTQPVLWLLVAMLLGSFRARQIEQRDELLLQADNLKNRGATLLDYTANLRSRCTMLERRLAIADNDDAGQVLASLGRLAEAEPGRWATALAAALDSGFPGGQFSLYAVDGDRIRLVLTHGQAESPGFAADVDVGHPLVSAVVGAARSVSVTTASDDAVLQGSCVAAVPVLAEVGQAAGTVIGILKADMLRPNQIDTSTTRRMAVVAKHLSPALKLGMLSPVAATEVDAAAGWRSTDRIARDGAAGPLEQAIPKLGRWPLSRWLSRTRSNGGETPDGKGG